MSSPTSVTLESISESVDYGVTASAAAASVGPKFLRITDIQNGQVDWEQVPWCECSERESNGARLAEGDIVFARTGATTGKSFLIRECPESAVFASYLIRVRLGSSALPSFVAHYFQSADYWAQISSNVRGVAQPGINATTLKSLRIPLPSLPEQRRIAAILDKADALRAKRREALAQLDRLAQSIFVEMFGDPVQNSKSWPTAKLGSLIRKLGSGATPTGGDAAYKPFGISLIRSMNVHDGEFVRRNLAFIDEQQAQKLQNVAVEAGDVLLNITGASVARVCRAPADVLPARVNQHVMIIRPSDELNPLFLERMLLNPSMKVHLLKVGGSGATREAITKAEAENLAVIVPPKTAQQAFARRMNEVAKLVATCESAASDLEVLFGSLQHRAFAGEL